MDDSVDRKDGCTLVLVFSLVTIGHLVTLQTMWQAIGYRFLEYHLNVLG